MFKNLLGGALKLSSLTILCCLGLALALPIAAEERIKIGVSTALTGEAADFGVDIRNALTLMNEQYGGGKYELVFADEQCSNREAISVAQRFISVEKVRYVLGFPCNQTLLVTAPIYDRAGVLVVTSAATSGDVLDIGRHIFRLFPSDERGAEVLYKYISRHQKKLLILTEQNEYPVLMERTIRKANRESETGIDIDSIAFIHGETDLRTVLLKGLSGGVDSVFINVNTDASFIAAFRQLKMFKFAGTIYAAYLPASPNIQRALGGALEGIVFSNLPSSSELLTEAGQDLLRQFTARFGEPKSGFPVVPTSFEAFRVLVEAIKSQEDAVQYLLKTRFTGKFIPDFYFNQHGAVEGIDFQVQKIQEGKVVVESN